MSLNLDYGSIFSSPRINGKSMPTAILIVYTKEGFLFCTDGLKRTSDGIAVADNVQKMFEIERSGNSSIAYGLAGSVGDPERPAFDFVSWMKDETESIPISRTTDLTVYMRAIAARVNERLRKIQKTDKALVLPPTPGGYKKPINDPTDTIAFALFAGYVAGSPDLGHIRFKHLKQVLREPETVQDKLEVGEPRGYVSQEIAYRLFNIDGDPLCGPYQVVNRKPSDRTLDDALNLVVSYFLAIKDPNVRALDEAHCASVGGMEGIRAATITAKDGFSWVENARIVRAFADVQVLVEEHSRKYVPS